MGVFKKIYNKISCQLHYQFKAVTPSYTEKPQKPTKKKTSFCRPCLASEKLGAKRQREQSGVFGEEKEIRWNTFKNKNNVTQWTISHLFFHILPRSPSLPSIKNTWTITLFHTYFHSLFLISSTVILSSLSNITLDPYWSQGYLSHS